MGKILFVRCVSCVYHQTALLSTAKSGCVWNFSLKVLFPVLLYSYMKVGCLDYTSMLGLLQGSCKICLFSVL